MLKFFFKKIVFLLSALFVIISITFFFMKMIPGDPFSDEQGIRKDMQEILMDQHGLNQPILAQYKNYLFQLSQCELGNSIKYKGCAVNQIIKTAFPVSALLGMQAFFIALFCGVFLGVLGAIKSNKWEDQSIIVLTTLGISIPSFILAALLQYVFAIYFPIFPMARWGCFSQTILPSLALALTPMAFIARLTRSSMLEVLKSDYIKGVRAKGLPMRYWLLKHALRNAFLPVLSFLGQLLANILVGSFVIEKIFSIPGLGQWFINSVASRDYPMIMGLTLFYSAILLVLVFVIDILYGFYDPRIRLIYSNKKVL